MASDNILDSYQVPNLPKIDNTGGSGSGLPGMPGLSSLKPSKADLRQQQAAAQEAMLDNFAESAWQNLNKMPGLQEGSVREWRRQTDFYLKDTLPKWLDQDPRFKNNPTARDDFLDEVTYRINNKLQDKIKPVEDASRLDAVAKGIGAAVDNLLTGGKGLWNSLIDRATNASEEDQRAHSRIFMDDIRADMKADLERQQDNPFYQNMRREEQEDERAKKGFINSITDSDHPVQKFAQMLLDQAPQMLASVAAGTAGAALGGAITKSPVGAVRGATAMLAATGAFLGMSQVAKDAFMDIYQADRKELESIGEYKELYEQFRKQGHEDEQADNYARAAVAYAAVKENNLKAAIPAALLSIIGPEAAIVRKSLVNKVLEKGIFKRSFPARAAARTALGATGEGLEEAAESMTSKYMANSALGRPTDLANISEGALDNFLAGVAVGGPLGAIGNINEARGKSGADGDKPSSDADNQTGGNGSPGPGPGPGTPPVLPGPGQTPADAANVAEQTVPGFSRAQEQRRSAAQALRALDDYFAPWRSATTPVTTRDLNDQQVTELAQYINTVNQGSSGKDIIGQYFTQLSHDTEQKVDINPQELLERYRIIQQNVSPSREQTTTGTVSNEAIAAAKDHLWNSRTKYSDVNEHINALFNKNGARTYTGINPQTGTQFTVPLDKLSLGSVTARLTKGLDPKSVAGQNEFSNRALSEYVSRGMDRDAANLMAAAATRVFSTTGKVRVDELRRSLLDIGEADWSAVATMEETNADNTTGGRAAGGAAGEAGNTGPGNPAQAGLGNAQSYSGNGQAAPGGGAGGASRADTGTAAPNVYPAQSQDGTPGNGADSGPGSAEPAADGAGSPAGERSPAGATEQRTVDGGLDTEAGGGATPGISYSQLNDILRSLRFSQTGQQTAARDIFTRTMDTLAKSWRTARGDVAVPANELRAMQVGAMVYTRMRLYLAQVANVSVNNILNVDLKLWESPGNSETFGFYRPVGPGRFFGQIALTTNAFRSNDNPGALVSTVLAHETAHAFIDAVETNRALLSTTATGRNLLQTMDSLRSVCSTGGTTWSKTAHERFAVALESYILTGKLPVTFGSLANDPAVTSTFARLAQAVKNSVAWVRQMLTRVLRDSRKTDDIMQDVPSYETDPELMARVSSELGDPEMNVFNHFHRYDLPRAAYMVEGRMPGPMLRLFRDILDNPADVANALPGADNTSPVILAELHNAEVVIANRLMTTGYEGMTNTDPVEAMNIAHEAVLNAASHIMRTPEQRAEAYSRKSREALDVAELAEPGVIEETDGEGVVLAGDDATVELAEQGIINPENDPEGAVETTGPNEPGNPQGMPDDETEYTARVTTTDSIIEEVSTGSADTTPRTPGWTSPDFLNNDFDVDRTMLRDENGLPRSMFYTHDSQVGLASDTPVADLTSTTYIRLGRTPGKNDKTPGLSELMQARDINDLQERVGKLRDSNTWNILAANYDTIPVTTADGNTHYLVCNLNVEAEAAYDQMQRENADPDSVSDAKPMEVESGPVPDDVMEARSSGPGPGPGANPYANVQAAMANMASIIARRAQANSQAVRTAEVNRNTRRWDAASYTYTQAQRAGWWQRFARSMRTVWDNKSWLYMWNVMNNAPTVGQAWSSPLNNAIYSTGARVDGARTEITRRFIDPLNEWARVKANDLGLGSGAWGQFLHDMGNARTFLHTIESSALRRQQLQDALLQAYTLPYGPDRDAAIDKARDDITKYNAKQANKAIKNGVYLDGGRTEAECVQGYNDLISKYGQSVVDEGVERVGQSMEGLVQHLIEQNVISETDILHFRQFAYYVPLMTQQDLRRNDDVTEVIASPNLMIEREGSEAPAVDGVSTLEKYANRAANAIGARDLGVELRNTYLRLRQQFLNGDAGVTHAERTLFRKGSDTQSLNYYNGLGMIEAGVLRAAATVPDANNPNAQYIRDTANQILNGKHIVVRVVEDTDLNGNPQTPVTKSYIVWFNREEMQGVNGLGESSVLESNARVNDALHSIYDNQPPVHMKTMRKLTGFYGSLNTTWKLTFPVYNAQNDFFERLAYTASRTFTKNTRGIREEVSGLAVARSMIGYMVRPTTQLKLLLSYGWNGNTSRFNAQDRAFMEEFRDSGIMSSASLSQYLRRQGDQAYAFLSGNPAVDKSLLGRLQNNPVQKLFHRWAEMWYTQSPAVEYMALRKNGISAEDARSFVLEQMNMRTKGSADRFMGWALPFIPSIGQTTLNFTNMLGLNATTFGHARSRDAQVRAAKNWIGIGVFAWGASMLIPFLASAFGDGDDEKGYKDVLDRMDLASIDSIMVPGEDGKAIKLLRVGFGPGRFVLQAAFGLDRVNRGTAEIGEVIKNLAASYVVNVSPFSQPVFDVKTVNDLGQKFAMMMTPVLLRPLAESFAFNRDFFGSTVARRDKYHDEKNRFSDERSGSTPRIWSDMVKGIYNVAGIDMYPEQLRNMVKGYATGPLQAVYKWFDNDPLVRDPAYAEHRSVIGDTLTLLGASSFFYKYGDTDQRNYYATQELFNDILRDRGLGVAMVGKGPYDRTNLEKQERVLRQAGFPPEFIHDYVNIRGTYYTLREMDKKYRKQVDGLIAGRGSEARLEAVCEKHYHDRARVLNKAVRQLRIYQNPSLRHDYLQAGNADNISRLRARGFMEQTE